MMRTFLGILSIICSFQILAQESIQDILDLVPTKEPMLLLPELLPSSLTEYNGTIAADGNELFYTAEVARKGMIMHVKRENGQWQTPIIASFSGQYSEYDPVFSPDGQRLYFCSRRPVEPEGEWGKAHVWRIHKDEHGNWSEPEHVILTENGDYFASEAKSGNLYFNQWNPGKLMCAKPKQGGGYEIEDLVTINDGGEAGDPYVDPDEDYIIFRGYMKDRLGAGDLYISYRDGESWTEPVNLGAPINSNSHEMCPYVTPDGKYLIFASNRTDNYPNFEPGDAISDVVQYQKSALNGMQNIYYISAGFIRELDPRD